MLPIAMLATPGASSAVSQANCRNSRAMPPSDGVWQGRRTGLGREQCGVSPISCRVVRAVCAAVHDVVSDRGVEHKCQVAPRDTHPDRLSSASDDRLAGSLIKKHHGWAEEAGRECRTRKTGGRSQQGRPRGSSTPRLEDLVRDGLFMFECA